jgi:hypothetical protein
MLNQPIKPLSESANILTRSSGSSHMPIDTDIHWSWSNPLNLLPACILLFVLLALIGAFFA